MALNYDLRINQGETWQLVIPVYLPIGGSLLGATVRGQVRSTSTAATALHTWDVTEGNVDIDGEAATITLHVPAAVSTDWSWLSGFWDLEMTDIFGTTTRLVEGVVWVSPEITR